jgi:hypothetical protein
MTYREELHFKEKEHVDVAHSIASSIRRIKAAFRQTNCLLIIGVFSINKARLQ